jgi:hypothetical protein
MRNLMASETFSTIQQERDGAIVHERNLHRGLKLARGYADAALLQRTDDILVKRLRDGGWRRVVE